MVKAVGTEDLPQYHTRKMRKDFLSKYLRLVKASTAHLNEIIVNLLVIIRLRLVNKKDCTVSGLPIFWLVMMKLNGKTGTSFTEFWDEVKKLFTEYEGSVQERRHGSFSYLPFVISIRELIDRVMKRPGPARPGILVPSAEWVRLQFAARNTYHRSALFHTGRFDMKFQVQRRQTRSQHEDVYHQQLYAKEFAIRFKDYCSLISSDDKALIPVGEPGNPISTGVRAHNASLGPAQSGDSSRRSGSCLENRWNQVQSEFVYRYTGVYVNIIFQWYSLCHLQERVFEPSSPMLPSYTIKSVLEMTR